MQIEDFADKILDVFAKQLNDQYKLIITLSIVTGVSVLTTIINVIVQFRLKEKEKSVSRFTIRENKRQSTYEHVYEKMQKLSLFTNGDDTAIYTNLVKDLNQYRVANKLYIDKKTNNVIDEFRNYMLNIIVDPRLKDVKKEDEIMDKFINEFTK